MSVGPKSVSSSAVVRIANANRERSRLVIVNTGKAASDNLTANASRVGLIRGEWKTFGLVEAELSLDPGEYVDLEGEDAAASWCAIASEETALRVEVLETLGPIRLALVRRPIG